MRALCGVILLLLGLCAACGAPRSQPTQRAWGVLYMVERWDRTASQLRLVDPDTGVDRAVAATVDGEVPAAGAPPQGLPANVQYAGASFDGRWAAYTAPIGDPPWPWMDVYVVQVASGASTKLPVSGWTCAWSPMGHDLAVVNNGGTDQNGLWLFDADTAHTRQLLTGTDVHEAEVRWSPDGSRIAVVGGNAFEAVVVVDVATGAKRTVNEVGDYRRRKLLSLSWSPQGDRIAFMQYVAEGAGVDECSECPFVVDLATGRETRLADKTFSGQFTWSPDGRQVVFDGPGGHSACCSIQKADLVTGEVTRLTGGGEDWLHILRWGWVTFVLAPEQ